VHLLIFLFLPDMCLNFLSCVLIQAYSVLEVLRPLYNSPKILEQKVTVAIYVNLQFRCRLAVVGLWYPVCNFADAPATHIYHFLFLNQ
jgi:hypothetical protein